MVKTVRADFDPDFTVQLKLWTYTTDALAYTFDLTEDITEDGSYYHTADILTNRYRSGLFIDGFVVQRSAIYIGPNENQTYRIGNWEGSIDVGPGAYYLAGTGAYIITATIKDSFNLPIENAYISLYRTGDQRHGKTNAAGQVVFNSDAVTWTSVSIVAQGYTFITSPLTIIGNVNLIYNGIPIIPILPPLVNQQVHVQAYVFDQYGQSENGVKIKSQMIVPSAISGVFDDSIAEFTSMNGIVTLTNLFQDAWYMIWRGKSKPMRYHVPVVAVGTTTINMDPLMGNDNIDPCL